MKKWIIRKLMRSLPEQIIMGENFLIVKATKITSLPPKVKGYNMIFTHEIDFRKVKRMEL